ncbi:MAG TPA: His/Gly/Thr/Pro-type tRNA ligase C-terminal domain-containing protein, partial [Candidatus Woesebacteria bacterium]|nr:His/Gly/Thr/Pro-type tRNA ligase C-terminal domain-containing protein [Candidatus Woesebacteria bacterium]
QMLAFAQKVGIKKDHLKIREHPKKELSHYSQKTVDIEYLFPFGQSELYGLAYRTDYDLRNHTEKSGVDLSYQDQKSGEKFFPHVVEPSFGLERTILALLLDAYHEEEVRGEKRTVLRLAPQIAPVKVAVFPLLANKEDLVKEAKRVFRELAASFISEFDDIGNIGKRYRRQDEIGTPWCVTIDFDTLKDNTVTVRDRDTMKQERVKINSLNDYFGQKLKNENA